MRRLLTACVVLLLLASSITFCSKKNTSANLIPLQHKWNITSLTGEVYYYKGQPADYFDFRVDKRLYRYSNGIYDTSIYTLSSDGYTLSLYPVQNGIQLPNVLPLTITTLSSSRLVFKYTGSSSLYILDSLSR